MEDFVQAIVIREKLNTHKPKDEFRIFTYGESSMHGAHHGSVSSPARWLELHLKNYLPNKKIRVINFARLGHGVDYTYKVFDETLVFKPDIAVFYNGHNDFMFKNRVDQLHLKRSPFRARIIAVFDKSRFISFLYRQLVKARMAKKITRQDLMGGEVIETRPNTSQELYRTQAEESIYLENLKFFEKRLTQLVQLANRKKVRTIFFNPVSSLKDFAPLESYHMKALSAGEIENWENLFAQGKALQAEGRLDEALDAFLKAHEAEPTYADLSFQIGRILYKQGRYDQAKKYFELARDNDANVVRATRHIHEIYQRIVKSHGIRLIDTEHALRSDIENGILGLPVIEDNVHFSIKAQHLLGKRLALEFAELRWITPKAEWQFDKEISYEQGLNELGVSDTLMVSSYVKIAGYLGRMFDQRLDFARRALHLQPDNPYAKRSMAWAYWLAGKREDALKLYEQLRQENPGHYQEVLQRAPDIHAALSSEPLMG